MSWFTNKNTQTPQQLKSATTRFIAEQDGTQERELKACFIGLFRKQPTFERAYLALAEHGDGTGIHVTLAMKVPVRRRFVADPEAGECFFIHVWLP